MRNNFPIYQQLDSMDCGATCLRMVARHFGRNYSLDYLRELTYIGKQGVDLLSISEAAEKLGLQTLAVRVPLERLLRDLPLPCIAHWDEDHFVVVYKATPSAIYIADPARGKRKLTTEEFLEHWAEMDEDGTPVGVLLLLQTTPEFFVREDDVVDRTKIRYLIPYFKRYRGLMVQLGLGLVLGILLQLLVPFLLKSIIDVGVDRVDAEYINMAIFALGILLFSQLTIELFRSYILLHVGARINISLVSDFLIQLTKMPLRFFETRLTGDLLQRISDNERVQRFLTSTSLMSVFSFFTFFAFAIILAIWSPAILSVFLTGTLLAVFWVALIGRLRKKSDTQQFDQLTENQGSLMELINGMREIKLHNAEKQKRWAWERIQAKLFTIGLETRQWEQLQRTGSAILNEGKNLLIIALAAHFVVDGQMTLGMMVAIMYIVGTQNAPINRMVEFLRSFQEARMSLERMNEIHLREEQEDPANKITLLPEDSDLVLDKVTFQYHGPGSKKVLRNISLRIPKGRTTAIVGTSGSGKTTLIKLLMNLYQPTEGVIRLGDISLANVDNRLWRSKCGGVLQDGYIFQDTIARNIALGDEIIDKQKLLKAVKAANIQSFVESLPLGYNTVVGREGQGLSEGQKQRLLIARLVYKAPDYIFLDEATIALDPYNELLIMENLDDIFTNATKVIVAHRMSTILEADNIIVLEDGELVEQGTHEELSYVQGAYYQLVRNQMELGG